MVGAKSSKHAKYTKSGLKGTSASFSFFRLAMRIEALRNRVSFFLRGLPTGNGSNGSNVMGRCFTSVVPMPELKAIFSFLLG